jgi:aryl-alcohol dehydrogenase-like predicted oxidoreductase
MLIKDLTPQPSIPLEQIDQIQSQIYESDIPFYRQLGRTGLKVSCLGLGGGGGISSEDALYAFDQGINYFFYSSDLHHYIYSFMSGALQKLCGRNSSVREKVVLGTVTYMKNPEMAIAALLDQFIELKIEYIDVFFWGWFGSQDGTNLESCLQLSPDLRGTNSVYQRFVEQIIGTSERMKKMGIVRYIGASFHDINLAQKWSNSPLLDVIMVRHNIAHRSAQNLVFNQLDAQNLQRPGIVTFKSTASHAGPLYKIPYGLPEKCWQPAVPDFYRYSLSQNCVDVCLTGWRNRQEVDAAIAAIQHGKLTPDEIAYLNLYGDLHRRKIPVSDISPELLIYR